MAHQSGRSALSYLVHAWTTQQVRAHIENEMARVCVCIAGCRFCCIVLQRIANQHSQFSLDRISGVNGLLVASALSISSLSSLSVRVLSCEFWFLLRKPILLWTEWSSFSDVRWWLDNNIWQLNTRIFVWKKRRKIQNNTVAPEWFFVFGKVICSIAVVCLAYLPE